MSRPARHLALLILCLAVLLASPTPASAQVVTGTPPFGSFGGGPDAINLANLNVHLTVPVFHKPGRGMDFNYNLAYDSSIWYPVGSSGSQSWHFATNWGWASNSAFGIGNEGYLVYTQTTTYCYDGQGHVDGADVFVGNSVYYDPWGTSHHFSGYVEQKNGGCGTSTVNTYPGTAADGSGLILQNPTGPVITTGGASLTPPSNPSGGGYSSSVTDRNGNEMNTDTSGHFYDTLSSSTPVLSVSGTVPNPITFAYTAPSGASAQYKMKFTTYSIQTNFGCTGIVDYGTNGTTTASLVSEIDLPDWNATTNPNSRYTFTYESTLGHSGFVTGRLASVTLPTGGTISYTYTGGSSGHITCADGSTASLTRTTPDGAWTYAQVKGTGAASTTTVTDPQQNQTVVQFQGIYETQRQSYQGLTSGTLLKTINICYNVSTPPCTGTAITFPIAKRTITHTLPGSANLQSQHVYNYNTTGSLTEQDDYDWGPGAVGPLLKKTAITYATLTNITSFRQQVTVTNGSGAVISQTNYNYGDTVTATSGTPQHTNPGGSRGNLLSINYYTHGTTYLTKSMSYFDTGKLQTVTDANGAQSTYTYGACGNSFPTSVSEPLTLSRSMTWNCTGGVQLTTTDENSQVTTSAYTDPYFWRPASVTDPTLAAADFVYTGQTNREMSLSFNGGSSVPDATTIRDGLGRPHLSQIRETVGGTNFDSSEIDYDSLGRPSRVTLPYVGTAGQTNPSAPAQTTTYDPLNRVLSISDNSGGSRTFSYVQNTVYITRGPAPTGENTKRRQEQYDALGRLTSVCEVTAGTTASPAGTCAQTVSQTGYWTKYTYDALGRLTGVTQNAQSANPQTRTFAYDLMGRVTSEANPETGTITRVYDTDATCGTSNGDVVKKTDAVGNVTCAAFDALHRPTSVTYPSGTYSGVTPAKHFVYDSATVNSVAMVNTKGRLAEAYTCTGSCTSKLTDEGFSYTVRGEPSDIYQSTPNSGNYYHISQAYWANGAPNQLNSNLATLPTITYTPDAEGRVYRASASSGQNPVTSTLYNAASLPTSVTYGSGDSDGYTYDPNTLRTTQYKFTVNGQSLIGNLTWNADHTLASQNITDPFDSADTQNCSYTHDDLTRLASVNCGSIWSQTFTYDAFGNISKSGTYSFLPIYTDTSGNTTNRFVSIPGTTVSYDANGNVLSDGAHTYTWDSAGKSISADSVNLTYDALGRMVEQNRSGAYTQIVYSPGGAKIALMSGLTLQKGLISLPGGGQAVYNSSGLQYYGHSDHLGSMKLGSTPSRTMAFALAYAPFGETYATSGTTDPSFTGQRQDTVAGLFDFPDRQYSTQGRWPNPDPSGMAAMHLSDPQTLNRYAYVRNNPLTLVDPSGLDEQDDCGADDFCSEGFGGGGGGGGGSPDPTSGGDPNNSGTLPTNVELILPDGTSYYRDPNGDYNYSVLVPASVSDNPLVETQGATLSTTLLEDCGGCLLGQIANDPQSMAIFFSSSDWIDLVVAVPTAAAAGAGCAYLGGVPCAAVLTGGAFATESTCYVTAACGESNGAWGTGPHPIEPEPNGGFSGPQSAPISGSPPSPPPPLPPLAP